MKYEIEPHFDAGNLKGVRYCGLKMFPGLDENTRTINNWGCLNYEFRDPDAQGAEAGEYDVSSNDRADVYAHCTRSGCRFFNPQVTAKK